MFRNLIVGKIQRAAHFVHSNQLSRVCSDANKYESFISVGLCYPQYELLRGSRSYVSVRLYDSREEFFKPNFVRNFSVARTSNSVANNAQVAWKRLLGKYSNSGHKFTLLGKNELSKHSFARTFSVTTVNKPTHDVQVAWKRIFGKFSHNNQALPLLRRDRFCRSSFIRNFTITTAGNSVAYPQGAWKRLLETYSINRQTFILSGRDRFPKHNFVRIFSKSTANNSMAYNAQFTWRKLSKMYSESGRKFHPLNTMAKVVTLALTRSNLFFPGVIGFRCGQLAQVQKVHTDNILLKKDRLYMPTQGGRAYVSTLVSSIFEGVILLLRSIYLSLLFTPSIVMAPFADCLGPTYRKIWLHVVLGTLERAGPAFIKWGQWAATRPDLFAKDLCAELAELHIKAPEHSFAFTKKTIENAFGRKLSEIFENFEESPIASGSIAQVYRASLKSRYPGKQIKPMVVAVKVRHPGVGESIRRDFVIINWIAKISTFTPAMKWLRLDESVQQFAVFMMSQVDLAREASNLNRFSYNFRKWKDVSFPKPVYPLVHPAVLVETYEQGESVAYYVDELQGQNRFKSALAHIGTHALLKMLLVDNFIHADMHPGNILVRVPPRKSSRKWPFRSKPHVVFLDVGMTAELSSNDRTNLIEFFEAVARRDGRTAAECTLRLSKKQNCPNPEAFIAEVKESFDFWGTPEGDLVHPADCMHHLLEQVRRHRVNVDGNVCTVLVTTLVLEGWQRKLDPEYDVMHTLRTLLLRRDWAKSLSYTIDGLMAP